MSKDTGARQVTAEERMRERAAEVCDQLWQEHEQARAELGSSYHEGAADAADQCESAIRALPLEGEQDQHNADEGQPHRVAESHAPALSESGDGGVAPTLDAAGTAHHSRTEQEGNLLAARPLLDTGTAAEVRPSSDKEASPVPAREPSADDLVRRINQLCGDTHPGLLVNVLSSELLQAWADVGEITRLRAENAALREKLQGGVVSEEVAARFSGDITVPKALLAEAYRGLKLHYEMPEVRREIDRLFAAAKETKK